MKTQPTAGKKIAARRTTQRACRLDDLNIPRVCLFLELFVGRDVTDRSTK